MTEPTPAPEASEPAWVPDAAAPPAQPAPPASPPAPPRDTTMLWLIPLVAAAALVVGLVGGFVIAHAFGVDGQRNSHVGIAGPGGVPGLGDGQGNRPDWDNDGNQGFPPGFGPPGSSQQNPTLPQQSTPSTPQQSS